MPTYEYECEKCGHRFETFQSMKDDPIKKCPEKGCKGKVRRLLGTGAGFNFKGSGFYITDYRSESYKAGAKKAEGASSGGGDSSTPSKSDSGSGSSGGSGSTGGSSGGSSSSGSSGGSGTGSAS